MAEKNTIEYNELRKILPQAHPFLLIDRVEDFKAGESLVAIKNVTGNEWSQDDSMFKVKFFPETLLIEAAAQAALVLYHVSKVKPQEKQPKYFLGRVNGEFLKSILEGDQITFLAFANKMLDNGGYSEVEISVKSVVIAKIEVIYSVKRQGLSFDLSKKK